MEGYPGARETRRPRFRSPFRRVGLGATPALDRAQAAESMGPQVPRCKLGEMWERSAESKGIR